MKLQFEENEYYLMKNGEELAIATTDESFIKELGAQMLSRENCEAIKNGYDLEELAINHAEGNDNYITAKNSFKVGIKTILEILGDKRFSEEDMKEAYGRGLGVKSFNSLIQSLQQTEWDVEVVTEPMNLDEIREQGKGFLNSNTNKPKIDSNGCLILKRK